MPASASRAFASVGDYPYEEAVRATFPEDPNDPLRGLLRSATPEAWIEQFDDRNSANRMTAGLTAAHTPFDWFTHRLTFGLDLTDQLNDQLEPLPEPAVRSVLQHRRRPRADGSQNRESVVYTTFDYAASATRDHVGERGVRRLPSGSRSTRGASRT